METGTRKRSFIKFPFDIIDREATSIIPNSISSIGEQFPAMVTIQNFETRTNLYINEYACDFLERRKSELLEMGKKYYSTFFPDDERKHINGQLRNLVQKKITDKTISFFQRIRPNETSEYSWFFTTSQIYSITQRTEIYLLHISLLVSKCSYMGKKLDSLVEENLILSKYSNRFKHLSEREREIMELISKGNSSLKIADLLCISIHTVNNHRKNIIKKIGKKNLVAFLKINSVFPSNSV